MDTPTIDAENKLRDREAQKRIGRRIHLARTAKGLSLQKTAKAAKTSVQFLTQIENGRQSMSAIKLGRLAQVLGVSVDYLIFGNPACSDEVALAIDYLAGMSQEEREMLRQCCAHLQQI